MKIKILAVAVTGMLLSGCGNDDNGSFPAFQVQAYDPAIQNMDASVSCEDGTTETGKTGFDGRANFTSLTVISTPETCTFTFIGGADAVDVSNGKSMDGITYIIPKGLASRDVSANTASPITTLIAKKLNGAAYTPEVAVEIMSDLGLGELINNGDIDITEFLLNTESVMNNLKTNAASQAAFSQLSAATAVLSDVLKANPDATPEEIDDITGASKALTDAIIAEHNNYPMNDSNELIYIEIDQALVDRVVKDVSENNPPVIIVPPTKPAEPTPPTPPTGGTSGSTSGLGA